MLIFALAKLGPNSRCLAAFWQMIWQEGVRCIVMATGLFENAVVSVSMNIYS